MMGLGCLNGLGLLVVWLAIENRYLSVERLFGRVECSW